MIIVFFYFGCISCSRQGLQLHTWALKCHQSKFINSKTIDNISSIVYRTMHELNIYITSRKKLESWDKVRNLLCEAKPRITATRKRNILIFSELRIIRTRQLRKKIYYSPRTEKFIKFRFSPVGVFFTY